LGEKLAKPDTDLNQEEAHRFVGDDPFQEKGRELGGYGLEVAYISFAFETWYSHQPKLDGCCAACVGRDE
jgi:hypothetical protein